MKPCALLPLLLLAACATTPLPFVIERGGTLPPERYQVLEHLAAGAAPIKVRKGADPVGNPEPFWAYAVDPGLDLAHTPLQVGPFTGAQGKAAEAAAALPARLVEALGGARLFARVGTATPGTGPSQGSLLLSGTVTRATTDSDGLSEVADTQVEARLTRGGAVVGVIQVNAAQLDSSSKRDAMVAVMLYSLVQGSRAGYVSGKFREVFEAIATGRTSGIDTEAFTKRFVRAPLDMEPSVFSE